MSQPFHIELALSLLALLRVFTSLFDCVSQVVQVGFDRAQRQKITRDFERELTIMYFVQFIKSSCQQTQSVVLPDLDLLWPVARCSLRHHNIICVYGAAFASDELWLVMDLAEAGTARTLLDWMQAQQGQQGQQARGNGRGNQGGRAQDSDSLPDAFPGLTRDPSSWGAFTAGDATPRARVELALGAARAIAHLHANKVQHR